MAASYNSVFEFIFTPRSWASAEKFPGKNTENSKKQENSTIKPLPGRGTEKIPKNSKKKQKWHFYASIYCISS